MVCLVGLQRRSLEKDTSGVSPCKMKVRMRTRITKVAVRTWYVSLYYKRYICPAGSVICMGRGRPSSVIGHHSLVSEPDAHSSPSLRLLQVPVASQYTGHTPVALSDQIDPARYTCRSSQSTARSPHSPYLTMTLAIEAHSINSTGLIP